MLLRPLQTICYGLLQKKPGDSKRKKSDDLDPPSVEKMPVLKEVDEEKLVHDNFWIIAKN